MAEIYGPRGGAWGDFQQLPLDLEVSNGAAPTQWGFDLFNALKRGRGEAEEVKWVGQPPKKK